MKLPNWMMLCVLLFAAMGQYSLNATASESPSALGFGQITMFEADAQPNASASLTQMPIDINKADASELSGLPGIGAKKAEAIVKYRELNGNFTSVEELVNVRGIGPKMLVKLVGYVSV